MSYTKDVQVERGEASVCDERHHAKEKGQAK